MAYEYNPLIKDCFQKKSEVTPADITRVESEISDLQSTTTDLKQKKVTKFFSANDYLEDNEIAQYQGEDDAVYNLSNGFFYKKNPAFSITLNADLFPYTIHKKIDWFLSDDTLKISQYYISDLNSSINDYFIRSDTHNHIELIFFAQTYAQSPALRQSAEAGILYFPYAVINGGFDFENYVTFQGSDYYYKGQIINFNQRGGGLPGMLCASMSAPYTRYFWLPVVLNFRPGTWLWAAFLYETNSNNELILLGVDNKLSAFDFCYYQLDFAETVSINVQGFDLTANPAFTAVQTDEIAEATESNAGLMSASDKKLLDSFSAHGLSSLYMNNYDFSYEVGQSLADGCQMLISSLSNDVKNNNYQIFLGTFGFNNLYLYEGCAYPAYPMSQYSAFTAMNVASGSRYKFGYSAGTWYFNSL